MIKARIRVLKNDIPRIGKALRGNAADIRREAAAELAADWKSRAHVITGAYRDSIHPEERGDKTTQVLAGVSYAGFEEYGTRHRPGHPAYTPAVEAMAAKYPGLFKRLV